MRIEILSIGALVLFGGSLFLEKVAPWGRMTPWWIVGAGALAVLLSFIFRSKFRTRLRNPSFGDILLNSLGLVILVIGFLSRQWPAAVAFLFEIWLVTLIFRDRETEEVEKCPAARSTSRGEPE